MCFVLIMIIAGSICAFPVLSQANDQSGEVILDSGADRTAPVTAVDTEFTTADGKPYRLIMTGLRAGNQERMVECLAENCFAGYQQTVTRGRFLAATSALWTLMGIWIRAATQSRS